MPARRVFRGFVLIRFLLPMILALVDVIRLHGRHFPREDVSNGVFAGVVVLVIADIVVTIGLLFFYRWARVGFVIWLLADFGFRLSLMHTAFVTPTSWALSFIVDTMDGALIAMSFLPPISAVFASKRPNQSLQLTAGRHDDQI
jgi:hypothetical protein